ncbi:MAG TPA: [protein-PII] uridylyltransferase [Nitrospiria bacterium]|nr:[protein-PII] uridylyltransferase [Nitrospiria bacterium]
MLKAYLKERLVEIQRHHAQGATGEQVIAALTDLTDEVIERIYRDGLQTVPPQERWKFDDGLAIAALGGYGRGERSPYSDIDIMFLHRPSLRGEIQKMAGTLLQNLWDVGFQVGHSARTVDDCVAIGKADLTVRTALMEARFLTGGRALFDQFRSRYQRKVASNRPGLFIKAKIRSRDAECEQYGTTIHLLEPHIKKSRGGLRDLHLLRWAAQARYGTSSLEQLKEHGVLSKQDFRALSEAQDFLWRIRNEMHFFSGRCQDTLTFEEQVRLAASWGYRDNPHLLGVEQFMQRYYDQTTAIAEITGRYLDGMTSRTVWRRLRDRWSHRKIGRYFVLSGQELSILSEFRSEVLSRGDRVLTLFRLAQENDARLSAETQRQLTDMMGQWDPNHFSNSEAYAVFLSILSANAKISETLRGLHRFRILEQILPAFRRVRGLMQFNLYHKYTVDEHCLRAVEEAEKLLVQEGGPARAFRETRSREVLFLGLLLHDLGKGLGGDHSQIGASLALETGQRLGFDSATTEQLVFLVGQHLIMTHVAFRRDLADDNVLLQFAKSVGTPETLRMLYILTMADVTAVGPGTLNAWKKDLLTELFTKTREILTGETTLVAEEEKIKQIRQTLHSRLRIHYDSEWLDNQLAAMTPRYLIATPPERIALDLERIHELQPKTVAVYAEDDPERNLTDYSVYTFDDITPGIFYKITSVLAAKGLQILGATITTWSNNVVVDRFQVQDPDFSGPSGPDRLRDLRNAITVVLLGEKEPEHPAEIVTRIRSYSQAFPKIAPVQIAVDSSTSDKYTIIEVFAPDRTGLLSVIAQSLFALGLSIQTAKVATHLDQIVDVFHVVDRTGQKIADPDRIRHLKETLSQGIEQFLETARVQ